MTISMDKVYLRMVDIYEKEIETALKHGQEHVKINFDSFRIGVKAYGFINSRITAKEKWESAIADGVVLPVGEKRIVGMLDVRYLLDKTNLLSEYKYKYIFLNEPSQIVKEDA